MKFEPPAILPVLKGLDPSLELVVALSGGLDSMVLLHALQELRSGELLQRPLRAIHVNHQLSPAARDWQKFCESSCQRLAVPLDCFTVKITPTPGRSPEELAREARYRVFEENLDENACLLMAHHQDDQLETLLLRLNRGSGPGGLAGMPRIRPLGRGLLLRPLLGFSRKCLHDFALQQNLLWVEDESNQSLDFDRNYWRVEILPRIAGRWPGYPSSWLKSMALCGEAAALNRELADQDLQAAAGADPRVVRIRPLRKLSPPRQRNVLRYWLETVAFPLPGWQLLQRLAEEILAGSNPSAKLECPAGVVQRYRGCLYLLGSLAEPGGMERRWSPSQQATLPLPNNGSLVVGALTGAGRRGGIAAGPCRLSPDLAPLTVRYRRGGEVLRLARRPGKSLKKLQQEFQVPPWLRHRQPLLFYGTHLVAVPGIGVAEAFVVAPDQPALAISWEAPDLLFGAGW